MANGGRRGGGRREPDNVNGGHAGGVTFVALGADGFRLGEFTLKSSTSNWQAAIRSRCLGAHGIFGASGDFADDEISAKVTFVNASKMRKSNLHGERKGLTLFVSLASKDNLEKLAKYALSNSYKVVLSARKNEIDAVGDDAANQHVAPRNRAPARQRAQQPARQQPARQQPARQQPAQQQPARQQPAQQQPAQQQPAPPASEAQENYAVKPRSVFSRDEAFTGQSCSLEVFHLHNASPSIAHVPFLSAEENESANSAYAAFMLLRDGGGVNAKGMAITPCGVSVEESVVTAFLYRLGISQPRVVTMMSAITRCMARILQTSTGTLQAALAPGEPSYLDTVCMAAAYLFQTNARSVSLGLIGDEAACIERAFYSAKTNRADTETMVFSALGACGVAVLIPTRHNSKLLSNIVDFVYECGTPLKAACHVLAQAGVRSGMTSNDARTQIEYASRGLEVNMQDAQMGIDTSNFFPAAAERKALRRAAQRAEEEAARAAAAAPAVDEVSRLRQELAEQQRLVEELLSQRGRSQGAGGGAGAGRGRERERDRLQRDRRDDARSRSPSEERQRRGHSLPPPPLPPPLPPAPNATDVASAAMELAAHVYFTRAATEADQQAAMLEQQASVAGNNAAAAQQQHMAAVAGGADSQTQFTLHMTAMLAAQNANNFAQQARYVRERANAARQAVPVLSVRAQSLIPMWQAPQAPIGGAGGPPVPASAAAAAGAMQA